MAKLNKNNLFTGLIGPIVMSNWKANPYIRSKGRKSKKPPTAAQLAHRKRITIMSKFIYSMHRLLDKTFNNFATNKTGANAAFSYNFKNAITGSYPSFTIDHSLVLVSRGDMPNAIETVVEAIGIGQLQFRWTNNAGTGQAKVSDKCITVIHYPERNITLYSNGFEKREHEMATIDIRQLTGKVVVCWILFMSVDEKEVANSIYLRTVVVL